MRFKTRLLVLFIPCLLLACGEPEDTRPGKPVAHRRAAFKEILLPFEAMGVQLRKNQYKAEQFTPLAKRLVEVKEVPWQYFTPDTLYPPTRAKAVVWSDAAGFESGRQDFLKAADALLLAAESRDLPRVKAAYDGLQETCRTCHKTFRE